MKKKIVKFNRLFSILNWIVINKSIIRRIRFFFSLSDEIFKFHCHYFLIFFSGFYIEFAYQQENNDNGTVRRRAFWFRGRGGENQQQQNQQEDDVEAGQVAEAADDGRPNHGRIACNIIDEMRAQERGEN